MKKFVSLQTEAFTSADYHNLSVEAQAALPALKHALGRLGIANQPGLAPAVALRMGKSPAVAQRALDDLVANGWLLRSQSVGCEMWWLKNHLRHEPNAVPGTRFMTSVISEADALPKNNPAVAEFLAYYHDLLGLDIPTGATPVEHSETAAATPKAVKKEPVVTEEEVDKVMARIREEYPGKKGGHTWPRTRDKVKALLLRCKTKDEARALAKRLVGAATVYCEERAEAGAIGTQMVKNALVFYGPDRHWEGSAEVWAERQAASVPAPVARTPMVFDGPNDGYEKSLALFAGEDE